MMTSKHLKIRPLLVNFEEEIPEPIATGDIVYDESRMILLANGRPALFEAGLVPGISTKMTRVGQETVDDD